MKDRFETALDAERYLAKTRGVDVKNKVVQVKSGAIGICKWGAVDFLKNRCRYNVVITTS